MRYIKTYESWGKTTVMDIREFFSNLQKIKYLFKDYYKIDNLFKEISIATDLQKPMTFFGFTNSTESFYQPIIDKVTNQIHKIFPLILKDDYQGIFNWCNHESDYNYFEKNTKKGILVNLKNHMSEVIAKGLNNDENKPYMSIKFWNRRKDENELRIIVEEIIKKSDLNDYYNFRIYSTDAVIEIAIIAKESIKFNTDQLEEIEKAKEYGEEKYKYLQDRILNKNDIDTSNKYNL